MPRERQRAMNFDIGKLCKDLASGTDAGAFGYDLLRWAGKQEIIDRVLSNKLLQTSRDKLQSAAKDFRGKDIPVLPFRLFKLFDTVGDRLGYEAPYFLRRKVLLVSALSAWLWNDPEDIATLEECIWALCDDYTWSLPSHMHGSSLTLEINTGYSNRSKRRDAALNLDLFACETGLALAEICALLGDRLNPFIVERARSEVMRRVIDSYMEKATIQHWEILDSNWCAVCAGSIGSAAMLLVENDLDLAAILRGLLPVMDRYIAGFSEDGACTEGLNYWTYGISFFVVFAELLGRRTAGKLDLLSDKRFPSIALFQQNCFFPGAATLTFSDVEANAKYRPGVTCFLAEHFQEVMAPPLESAMDVMHSHCYNFAPALSDLLWTTNTLVSKQAQPQLCVIYEKAQWLLCSGDDDTGFAAKAGNNDEEHNHNDVGSFLFSRHGVMLLCDIGMGEYTKSYFGPGRYDTFCTSSRSHNIPIVDGNSQRDGKEYCARNVTFYDSGSMSMDIAPAYAVDGLTSLMRYLSFDNKTGSLSLLDEIKVSRPMEVVERFISFVRPCIEDGAVIIEEGATSCTLLTKTAQVPQIGITEHVNHQGKALDVYTIDYTIFLKECAVFEVVVS
ncbi:hypothetical protein V496_07993 [Pseudogymnoascus sp. VKM F-4515 (FW-2607)]|nr:hypothetical protein V496_07993 [Pseudogymnoascus sp. VKM F-4515 (FW-2607)]KFZ00264.1 hypothetical protein V498_00196 [Pseudogymnoascus sp. VKM F-4517 (FW-2822)]